MHRPQLKKSIVSLALFLCLHLVAARLEAQESYKVDEVINPRCDLSEVPQITDPPPTGRIFAALAGNQEARAAIIVHGMQGQARRYAESVRRWMIESRGVDPERLVAMYGGPSDEMRLELWLVPQGASLPAANLADDYSKATKFDTYGYWDGESCASDRLPALAIFVEALKQRPDWQGYIVVRPHRNRRGMSEGDAGWDPDGNLSRPQALARAATDKRYLVEKFGLPSAGLKAVVGDKDEWTHAELWLVPPGAEPPAPEAKN